MKVFEIREDLEMWKRFAESILGFGYHIANAKLFILGQMIERRIGITGMFGHGYKHDQRLYDIVQIIEYAKEATANEKTIYVHTIIEWLSGCINTIDEQEAREKYQREREIQEQEKYRLMRENAEVLGKIAQDIEMSENAQEKAEVRAVRIDDYYREIVPPDSMGEIPF